jgi:hypothetical protein
VIFRPRPLTEYVPAAVSRSSGRGDVEEISSPELQGNPKEVIVVAVTARHGDSYGVYRLDSAGFISGFLGAETALPVVQILHCPWAKLAQA